MNTAAAPKPPATSVWTMYRAIVGIGILCALMIVSVFQLTAAPIRANQDRALKQAISEVLPAARTVLSVGIDDAGGLKETDPAEMALPAFLGYGDDGALAGAAISAIGMGYQDNIRVLYAYSFEKNAIVGFKVLETKETPGLGDKIEKEPHFLANFEALDVSLADDGRSLRNPLVTVKQGEKTDPWQLDGITGATITSVAIGEILNGSARSWVPVLEREARSMTPPEPEPATAGEGS